MINKLFGFPPNPPSARLCAFRETNDSVATKPSRRVALNSMTKPAKVNIHHGSNAANLSVFPQSSRVMNVIRHTHSYEQTSPIDCPLPCGMRERISSVPHEPSAALNQKPPSAHKYIIGTYYLAMSRRSRGIAIDKAVNSKHK